MDGQHLNKFIEWIDMVVESDDLYFSDDIGWFIDEPDKKEWLLLGFSIWALAKEMLRSRNVDAVVELGLTLNTVKRPTGIPKKLTDNLFRNVLSEPTLYVSKDCDDTLQRYEEAFKETDASSLGLPFNCRVFYSEEKVSDYDYCIYYRYLLFCSTIRTQNHERR